VKNEKKENKGSLKKKASTAKTNPAKKKFPTSTLATDFTVRSHTVTERRVLCSVTPVLCGHMILVQAMILGWVGVLFVVSVALLAHPMDKPDGLYYQK